MQLATVSDYITQARRLLNDTGVTSQRYTDQQIVDALNLGILEMSRVRPDLFFKNRRTGGSFTDYTTAGATSVVVDLQYRHPLLMFIVGFIGLGDDAETQDARVTILLNKFVAQLTTPQA